MEGQVTHTIKIDMNTIKQMWSIRKRKYKRDFKTRLMFDSMLKEIILNGSEE